MAADARNLYNALTAAAIEQAPKLRPDSEWPLLVLVAHGDTVTPLVPPHPGDKRELAGILGGWIPTMISQVPTRPHAAALQWPAPVDNQGAVHVLALDVQVAWESYALINRRNVARLSPILGEFNPPVQTPFPASAATAEHFAHRCLLFSLGLVE